MNTWSLVKDIKKNLFGDIPYAIFKFFGSMSEDTLEMVVLMASFF